MPACRRRRGVVQVAASRIPNRVYEPTPRAPASVRGRPAPCPPRDRTPASRGFHDHPATRSLPAARARRAPTGRRGRRTPGRPTAIARHAQGQPATAGRRRDERPEMSVIVMGCWGCSSAGRASRSQCEGQEFDPPHLHQQTPKALIHQGLFLLLRPTSMGMSNSMSKFARRNAPEPAAVSFQDASFPTSGRAAEPTSPPRDKSCIQPTSTAPWRPPGGWNCAPTQRSNRRRRTTLNPTDRRSPERLRERSLALHALAVAKLQRQPELIERVRDTMRRWQAQRSFAASLATPDWREIVSGGVAAIAAAALDPSDRGDRLRAASPLTGILSEAERRGLLDRWSTGHLSR